MRKSLLEREAQCIRGTSTSLVALEVDLYETVYRRVSWCFCPIWPCKQPYSAEQLLLGKDRAGPEIFPKAHVVKVWSLRWQ